VMAPSTNKLILGRRWKTHC